jgi:hypothetical protein
MAQQDAQPSDPRFQYYLTLIEDTTKLSDRRQTANDLFVGLNVVIFTGMGVLFYGSHLRSWWVTGVFAAISILALLLNITWLRLNARYRRLVRLRIEYMTQLETELNAQAIFAQFPERSGKQAKKQPVQALSADAPEQMAQGNTPPLTHRPGIFAAEYERLYYQGSQVGFSTLERTLILIFMVAYVLATLGVGVATYLITTHVISRVAF